jgi:hypothetical protein
MNESMEIEHDDWAYRLPKLRSAGKITVGDIHGILPFSGVRNPITASKTSQKVMMIYKTAANHWQPRVGAAESLAEAAVAEDALTSPGVHDVEFQPVEFGYEYPSRSRRSHTIDLRVTFTSGLRRFIFVRNRSSLLKPWVQEEIDAIHAAVPAQEAHEFIIINADDYSRARRDNLRRMYRLTSFQTDPEADELVFDAVCRLKTLWKMSDLRSVIDLVPARIFQSCLRLIAQQRLGADLDAVICHHSRIWKMEA